MITPNPYLRLVSLTLALLFTLLSFSAHADDSSLLGLELTENPTSSLEFWALDGEENLSELTPETFFAAAPVVGVAALPAFVKYLSSVAQALNGKAVKMILAAGAVFAVVGSKIYSLTSEPSLGMETELSTAVLLSEDWHKESIVLKHLHKLQKKVKLGGPEEEKLLLADLKEGRYEVPSHPMVPVTVKAERKFKKHAIKEIEFRQNYYAQSQDLASWRRLLMEDISFTLELIKLNNAKEQKEEDEYRELKRDQRRLIKEMRRLPWKAKDFD